MASPWRAFLSAIGVLPFALSVAACGHPAQRALEGRWFGDAAESFDPRDLAAVTGWVRGMTLEFSGSALTVSIPAEDPRSGSYEIVSAHDGNLVITVLEPKGKRKQTARLTIENDHLLRWHLGEGRSVLLRRET